MVDIIEPQKYNTVRFTGVSILPYVGNCLPFSGMDKHNMVIHDGCAQEDYPMYFIEGGVQKYITGLNEEGKEVTSIQDDKLRQAKILEIRRFIAKCERELGGNHSCTDKNIEDKELFYSTVKTFKSIFPAVWVEDQNGIRKITETYWDKLGLVLRNEGYTLNTSNTEDRLRQYIVEAGGYGLVSPSLDRAKNGNFSFYLDKVSDTAKEGASLRILRDKSGAMLSKMMEKDHTKLLYITKLISAYPLQWKKDPEVTPLELMYMECSDFMDGEGIEKNKRNAIGRFIELASQDIDDLKVHNYINDGFRKGWLSTGTEGTITYTKTSTVLGKGTPNVFAYLKAGGPAEPVYVELSKLCEQEWQK
jgi:hypothetical protein